MNTKLTLRLDDDLIRRAKRHSEKSGKSVSRLVADYFSLIEASDGLDAGELTPRVRSLVGALSGATLDERDYLAYLQEKHQ